MLLTISLMMLRALTESCLGALGALSLICGGAPLGPSPNVDPVDLSTLREAAERVQTIRAVPKNESCPEI